MNYFQHNQPFELEGGQTLPEITVAYHTFGKLNANKSNVVWICHALTANSDVLDWWGGIVGESKIIDPERHFIVCANILGSCYGSTGPLSINPETQEPYYTSFPQVTIRDTVKAHILLREHLGLEKIQVLAGGSCGGFQVLEWAVAEPEVVENLFLLATAAAESTWGIGIHTTQRLMLEADGTWGEPSPTAGDKGLKAARALGTLTYRNYQILAQSQTDPDPEKLDNYRVSSYLNYQGDKLVKRFNAYSYWILTKALDSHHLGRGRGGRLEPVLAKIRQKTLIIGISSDILCPVQEQQFLAQHLPEATYVEIDSDYGHDGFIIEGQKISQHYTAWLSKVQKTNPVSGSFLSV
ncbi:homoserine O-acetyltransferase MetX [Rufibacter tibetensis]|uniref:Homoserine O-acetyltransferase n=1 Tax=Rufibacter tibetensis TaxID=512763 RepID=A0A0P0C0P7_9BACT|nr:homoserine O-acetyltransferase [Rufibacter tibetensis]ALI98389.1 homoserine O-acetyltransferase [Rufibacter tibetensis]